MISDNKKKRFKNLKNQVFILDVVENDGIDFSLDIRKEP